MHGANNQFINDPIGYCGAVAVNTVRWFTSANARVVNGIQVDAMRINMLSQLKYGNFDLTPQPMHGGSPVVDLTLPGAMLAMDIPLTAYWCPFNIGNVLPGFVDVPRQNPVYRFVFTVAMNGCALMATDSPLGAGHFRVYHHQHPGSATVNNLITAVGHPVLSYLSYDDYCDPNVIVPNAFNFLYYRNGRWIYVTQTQVLNMLTLQVSRHPIRAVQIADVLP